jgi:hypothetical protein
VELENRRQQPSIQFGVTAKVGASQRLRSSCMPRSSFDGRLDCVTSLTGFSHRPKDLIGDEASVRDITHTAPVDE